MILSAGRGKRLRPLTDVTPKPLIELRGKPLIVYHIEALKKAGITDIVINLAHLSDKIQKYLGNGNQFGINITYSLEPVGGLETGGGIVKALPLLGEEPFWAVNADIYTDFNFSQPITLNDDLAHLVLVDNPPHNMQGDFYLKDERVIFSQPEGSSYTFSGIAVYHPALFEGFDVDRFSIISLLNKAIEQQRVNGHHHHGRWFDIGCPKRLALAKAAV